MEVYHYPDPVLRERARPVEQFDERLAALAADMVKTMTEANGLGLAAPQVGLSLKVVVVSADGQPGKEMVLVNPEIVSTEGAEVAEEGCLSFPGIFVKIRRFHRVGVRYRDVRGEVHEAEVEGLLARAVQHELDHLDGRLLVDRMSPVQRVAQRRRLRELKDRYERRAGRTAAGSKTNR
ncbi:MAG TPA: peptide deformylase [Phycisphaerae bacterium]|nr:peptide deformylase [Phycisphaerae bacterium]